MSDFEKQNEATARLREALNKGTEPNGEDLDLVLSYMEERERQINRTMEFMRSGGQWRLGEAMAGDFARLRELGE